MKYEKELQDFFSANRDEMISDVARLVNINSERMDPLENAPFGSGVACCMAEAESMLQGYGFDVKNYDGKVLVFDFGPDDRQLDIVAHLDVVTAGNGWTVTEPFSMKILDGKIYGRGTADDKGPAVCAMYAIRAMKELSIPLKHGLRMILGGAEETGGEDLDDYYEREKPARMSFSPDGDFPLVNIEKGILRYGFSSDAAVSEKLPRVISIKGGTMINIVADEAQAVIEGISVQEAEDAVGRLSSACKNVLFSFSGDDKRLRITAAGVTAHASTPQEGENAITALLALLEELPLSACALHDQIRYIASMFPHGDYYGEALGTAMEDERSGRSTYSLDIISLSDQGFSGRFDCRLSILADDENTTKVIADKLTAAGLQPEDGCIHPPHIVDENSKVVRGLMKAYREVTGEKDAKPIAIGGGSYLHGIENGVAFGCAVPGVDNHMHGPDEFMVINQMMKSCEIFAQAIINLCGEGMEEV